MSSKPTLSPWVRFRNRAVAVPLVLFGKYPRRTRTLRRLVRYLDDKAVWQAAGGAVDRDWAILDDYFDQAGTAKGHYFHQDLLVATFIQKAAPVRHVDVASRVDGFVAHVAAFREIEVIDIRPLVLAGHPNIRFVQGNLMALDPSLHESCDSLSCLHAIEHFGLGRYGDPIDPQGHLTGFRNLVRMLKPGGTLYMGFPIGESAVHFNAHRVFAPTEVLGWAADQLTLQRFDYVDDAGDLHVQQSPQQTPKLDYGCGIYTFRKNG